MAIKMLGYPVTSNFGAVDKAHFVPHGGIDIACPSGTQAQSLVDGVVTKVYNDPLLGQTLKINTGGSNELVYGHLSKVSVSPGQEVYVGDLVGLTGGVPGTPGAGNSTGAHLHLSFLQNGTPVDPDASSSLLDRTMHFLNTPIHQYFGIEQVSVTERILNWIGDKVVAFIHVSPEILTVLAMAFLLMGMVGCNKFIRYAGTCILLSFVGVILDAAL